MRNSIIKNLFIICFISISGFCQAQETTVKRDYTISVNSKTDKVAMTKEELKNATFGVHTFNPELEGKVSLVEFSLKCPGQPTIRVIKSDKLSDIAIQSVMKSKIGDPITVFNPIFRIDGKDKTESNSNIIITLK